MDYIMIPANVAYFVLGFISCFALLLVCAIINGKKEMKKKEEIAKKLIKQLEKNEDEK